MSFEVSADAYLRFMGQYSEPLAVRFADLAGVGPGQRVLDVGSGPGALTAELVRRTGADAVSGAEPSASFARAVRDRLPGVDVRQATAERLPFPDDAFDVALAQSVVHFMADPVRVLVRRPWPGPGRRLLPAAPVDIDATVWAVTCRTPADPVTVRQADQGDVDALRRIATAAYQHYTARIGRPPAPMSADYDPRRGYTQTHRAEQGGFRRVFFRKPLT